MHYAIFLQTEWWSDRVAWRVADAAGRLIAEGMAPTMEAATICAREAARYCAKERESRGIAG